MGGDGGGPVLTVSLSAPIMGVTGPIDVVEFVRGPGLGELVGFLDESSDLAIARSLDALCFRPEWLIHVLGRCAGVPKAGAERIAARDILALGGALRPFVLGTASAGVPSDDSPSDTDGDPETSPA